MSKNNIITGAGSWYNQLAKVIEVAQAGGSFTDVPEANYSFAHDDKGDVKISLDKHQQEIDDKQMKDLFDQIKQGGAISTQTVEYIQGKMAGELAAGEAWVAEQK